MPPNWAWICISLVCVPVPHVLLQLDHCDTTQLTNARHILLDVFFFVKVNDLPGQFFKLQLLVSWLGHCVPPDWAWLCISLVCFPSPHVLLQLDHCDNTQSTNKKTNLLNVFFVNVVD